MVSDCAIVPRLTRVTAALTSPGLPALDSPSSASVLPWRHPVQTRISPKKTSAAIIHLLFFDIACPWYDRRSRTMRRSYPRGCLETRTGNASEPDLGWDLPAAYFMRQQLEP